MDKEPKVLFGDDPSKELNEVKKLIENDEVDVESKPYPLSAFCGLSSNDELVKSGLKIGVENDADFILIERFQKEDENNQMQDWLMIKIIHLKNTAMLV